MSRKDYNAFARILRNARGFAEGESKAEIEYIETELAAMFRADNPAFDEVRFLKACRSKA